MERCAGWFKGCRPIAPRRERLAINFAAVVKLAFLRQYLRTLRPLDRTRLSLNQGERLLIERNGFASRAEILINTRFAADALIDLVIFEARERADRSITRRLLKSPPSVSGARLARTSRPRPRAGITRSSPRPAPRAQFPRR
ncbi:hypothetical protein FHG71_22895 [Rubellimicrobium roseum]|uniref:Uncharacterized protein n=1 Tax=Rubellimicrobium roseum TaxID=687525 RepID=A0A5C4N5G0_9RHOB|nr:hypothetical protein FHG71_22895 [Rubellimicrobium roseum]